MNSIICKSNHQSVTSYLWYLHEKSFEPVRSYARVGSQRVKNVADNLLRLLRDAAVVGRREQRTARLEEIRQKIPHHCHKHTAPPGAVVQTQTREARLCARWCLPRITRKDLHNFLASHVRPVDMEEENKHDQSNVRTNIPSTFSKEVKTNMSNA